MSKDELCRRIAVQLPEALGFAILADDGARWLGAHALEGGELDDALRAAVAGVINGEAVAALLGEAARLHGLGTPPRADGDAMVVLGAQSAFVRRVRGAWAVVLMRTESSLGKGWGAIARAVSLVPADELG
jgi:hypothetical protein